MKLRLDSILSKPCTGSEAWKAKIVAMSFSPDNKLLAVAAVDRIITIYNEKGKKVDKFTSKPNGKGPKTYVIRSICFCPDGSFSKLAVAQSDNIIYIYKWASLGGAILSDAKEENLIGKKSICNKFSEATSVACLVWPFQHPFEIVYGLSEGKVKIGHLRSNKAQTLYTGDSYVTSLTMNKHESAVVSAHVDGSIFLCYLPSRGKNATCSKIAHHPCPTYGIAWGRSICVSGDDKRVVFYSVEGNVEHVFDHKDSMKESPTCASFNPAGETVVVGNLNCFSCYSWNKKENKWEEDSKNVVENMYSVTAFAWKANGSMLAVGTVCGLLDIYGACIRRYIYKNTFEITYVSQSQVLIRHKDDIQLDPTCLVTSKGNEIVKINIFRDPENNAHRYVVARTKTSLLLCDLECSMNLTSEIEWTSSSEKERFIFDSPNACIISRAGEVSIVEYGESFILGSIRTEIISAHLMSVRLNEKKTLQARDCDVGNKEENARLQNKKIAFLMDKQTISIKDLISEANTSVSHDAGIDFIELNAKGSLLLFRDKNQFLHLFDINGQRRYMLTNNCGYAQWVPGSDVLVAQSSNKMCVWYNIKAPDQFTSREIRGEIDGIERSEGKTEVIVDEVSSVSSYLLVEELIDFGAAIDDGDYAIAIQILESMEFSPQAEAMWKQLQKLCLEEWNLKLGERCAAALGDVSCARYLRRLWKITKTTRESGIRIQDHWQVRAKMALLKGQLDRAESIYLEHSKLQDAIDMYEEISMFSKAIAVADKNSYPGIDDMKTRYFQQLLDLNQNEEAGMMKEVEGDFSQAINLYLRSGLPGKAARVIHEHDIIQPSSLLESVAFALSDANMHSKAGEVHERLGERQKAMSSFVKGREYRKAANLAKVTFQIKSFR